MKTIIAGSRDITDYKKICSAIKKSGFRITEVVSGRAPGVDTLGEQWADDNTVPIKPFPADWNNLTAPGARIKTNRWGKQYNANAGHDRNQQMAEYAEALVAVWDGASPGTKSMIDYARKRNLRIYVMVFS